MAKNTLVLIYQIEAKVYTHDFHRDMISCLHLNFASVAGTMGYWAPEVWGVFKTLSQDTTYTDRVDVFALGLIFLFISEPTAALDSEVIMIVRFLKRKKKEEDIKRKKKEKDKERKR
jgi:serine/threonine protein kinase